MGWVICDRLYEWLCGGWFLCWLFGWWVDKGFVLAFSLFMGLWFELYSLEMSQIVRYREIE